MCSTQSKKTSLQWWCLCIAWSIALVSTLCVLFIGEVLGQMPCVLCWYQRIPMFALVFILGTACLRPSNEVGYYAMPLSILGLILAVYHSLFYSGLLTQKITQCGAISCDGNGMTIFWNLPIPYLSVVCFVAISALIYIFMREKHSVT